MHLSLSVVKNKVAIQFRDRTAITNVFQCETAFDFCDHSLYYIQCEHLSRLCTMHDFNANMTCY